MRLRAASLCQIIRETNMVRNFFVKYFILLFAVIQLTPCGVHWQSNLTPLWIFSPAPSQASQV